VAVASIYRLRHAAKRPSFISVANRGAQFELESKRSLPTGTTNNGRDYVENIQVTRYCLKDRIQHICEL
jgi:hypothetical protein